MAHVSQHQLPIDGDGICMLCKATPLEGERLTCKTCVTPWHVGCLYVLPETLDSTAYWECPDCITLPGDLPEVSGGQSFTPGESSSGLVAEIRAIEADHSLTEREKAKRRQELLGGKAGKEEDEDEVGKKRKRQNVSSVLGHFECAVCCAVPERPVSTPCGHNFCLRCFQKWTGQERKRTCITCRHPIPIKMATQPRINSTLVAAIRMAKMDHAYGPTLPQRVYHFVHNQDRPDKAFMTERSQRKGKSNAASGKIFVTIPSDHFGPIPAENDPERNQGVLVGETWEDRMECRQWGAHFPHVAGIAGQSNYGAQSVVLSGGYQDDEDHGEWFLYTGSGGRDLSGNKRTSKDQSFDQAFEKMNKALLASCLKGYPVRVVRSHKEKRSSYAPEKGLRYDGVYRIEKCWRKVGIQGYKVCRYLFVRCDNAPAPWTSDEHGDRPRTPPKIPELLSATDITKRKGEPSWGFDADENSWKWLKPPPVSQRPVGIPDSDSLKSSRRAIRRTKQLTIRQKLLKEFSCVICKEVMNHPVTTPCAHNFCKVCLEGAFAGKTFIRDRNKGGRSLRSQKNVMTCPSCPNDISDFLKNPQVNRELLDMIETLKNKPEEDEGADADGEGEDSGDEENLERHEEEAEPENKKEKEDDNKEGMVVDRKMKGILIDEGCEDMQEKMEEKAAAAMVQEDRDASPSSPLQVRSEEDDFE